MEFFNSAVGVLQTLVIALGAGLGIWGVINLLPSSVSPSYLCSPVCSVNRPAVIAYERHTRQTQ